MKKTTTTTTVKETDNTLTNAMQSITLALNSLVAGVKNLQNSNIQDASTIATIKQAINERNNIIASFGEQLGIIGEDIRTNSKVIKELSLDNQALIDDIEVDLMATYEDIENDLEDDDENDCDNCPYKKEEEVEETDIEEEDD